MLPWVLFLQQCNAVVPSFFVRFSAGCCERHKLDEFSGLIVSSKTRAHSTDPGTALVAL
jgi:hypothetical protein